MSPLPNESLLPGKLNVPGPNSSTVDLVRRSGARVVAEVGVYEGATSEPLAEIVTERGGELHLFDYADRVEPLVERLRSAGHVGVVAHGNSHKLMDSYNWSLMKILREREEPLFDYVFIDGAHLWSVDALTCLLADRLLRDGGYLDFDDYTWSLAKSETMNPDAFPRTAEYHTAEQIAEPQVALVVDLLVRRDPRYEEVLPNKAFRKRRRRRLSLPARAEPV